MHENSKQPPCPVPNSPGADHDGGGELGVLFLIYEDTYPAACGACCQALGLTKTGPMQWPPTE